MSLFKTLFYRDCKISYRQSSDYALALSFWILFIVFFPLTSTNNPALLQFFAPGIIWLGLLFTQLLHSHKLFREEDQEGMLAELRQSAHDFFEIILYKLFNFWILHYLPILLLAPLLALMLNLSSHALLILEITLLLGSPTLMLLSALVASLTLSLKNNTLLMNLLLLPLTIPILIFATHAVSNSMLGISTHALLAWLGVLLLLTLITIPYAICFVLKWDQS